LNAKPERSTGIVSRQTFVLQDRFRFVRNVDETSKSPKGDNPRSSRRSRISTFTGGGSVARIVRSDVLDGVIVTVRGVGCSRSRLGLCRRLDGPGRRVGLSGTGSTGCGGGRVAVQAGVVVRGQLVEVDGSGRGGLRGGHDAQKWYGRVRGKGRAMDRGSLITNSSATLQYNDL
jgi:hypothetical protein